VLIGRSVSGRWLAAAEDHGVIAELAVVERGVAGAVVELADVGVALGDPERRPVDRGPLVALVPVGDDRGAGVLGGGGQDEVAGVTQGGEGGVAFTGADRLELGERLRIVLAGYFGELDAALAIDEGAESAAGVDL
jgi:hypothetical protein